VTPLPGVVQSTGLILATVLAAAGLNLGVMSLGQADGDGTDVDTAATPTSTDAGLQALDDTAPATVDPGAVTTVAPTDPTVPDPAVIGSSQPAGTGVAPGPPVASGASPAPAGPGTAATGTSPPSTAAGSTVATQPTTDTALSTSTQAPGTVPSAPVATARPTTTATVTTLRPTTSTTRAAQTANYDHAVTGAGSLTVSVADGSRLSLVSVSDDSGWSHTVDTNRSDLVKVVFTRRGSEIAVSVTLRNGVPNFNEERGDDD